MTATYWVFNRDNHTKLGEIKWYSAWRKYAFFPSPATLFESQCLQDISQFCATITWEYLRKDKPLPLIHPNP